MRAWRGQDNAGNPINVVYYGLAWWPSYSYMFVPGTAGYDDLDTEALLVPRINSVLLRRDASGF